jgi:AcrR family transcriptional regulator
MSRSVRPSGRPRRADASRSREAILDAAAAVLARDPRAGLAEVADAADVSRQTVYAHFSSRAVLVDAVVDRAAGRINKTLEEARLDDLPADHALLRLIEIGWDEIQTTELLLALPAETGDERERARHEPVRRLLTEIASRGQEEGAFDPGLPVDWIADATIALGHAAGEQVRSGGMTGKRAREVLASTLSRLFRA